LDLHRNCPQLAPAVGCTGALRQWDFAVGGARLPLPDEEAALVLPRFDSIYSLSPSGGSAQLELRRAAQAGRAPAATPTPLGPGPASCAHMRASAPQRPAGALALASRAESLGVADCGGGRRASPRRRAEQAEQAEQAGRDAIQRSWISGRRCRVRQPARGPRRWRLGGGAILASLMRRQLTLYDRKPWGGPSSGSIFTTLMRQQLTQTDRPRTMLISA